MQYLIYPMKTISFTQTEFGLNPNWSHHLIPAIDMNGKDGGIEQGYAPCNLRVFKVDTYANTVYFSTMEEVMAADGTVDYFTIAMTHDNDISDIKVGQTFYTGQKCYDEGTKNASGNHIHIEVARGRNRQKAYYTVNGQRVWKFSSAYAVKPTDVFFALEGWNTLRAGYQMGVNIKWVKDRYVDDEVYDMKLKVDTVKGAQYIREKISFNSKNKANGKILATVPKNNKEMIITGFVDGLQKDGYQWVKVKWRDIEGYAQWDSMYFTVYEY